MTRRIQPEVLKKDRDTLVALTGLADYAPRKDAFKTATLSASKTTLDAAETRLLRARAELDAASDAYHAAGVAFHDGIVGARDEVKVQYGDSSDEYAAVGRTKKTERKAPRRRATKTEVPV